MNQNTVFHNIPSVIKHRYNSLLYYVLVRVVIKLTGHDTGLIIPTACRILSSNSRLAPAEALTGHNLLQGYVSFVHTFPATRHTQRSK